MKPETRRAFDAKRAEIGKYPFRDGAFTRDRDAAMEALFIAGMMEAARLCRDVANRTDTLTGQYHADGAEDCAELIEASVKGE